MDGNKTYAVAGGFLVMALGGLLSGQMDWQAALATVLAGAGLAAIRHAIAKIGEKHAQLARTLDMLVSTGATVEQKK